MSLTRVAQVEKGWYKFCDFKLGEKVENAIKEHIHGRAAGDNKASPPPAVVLQSNETLNPLLIRIFMSLTSPQSWKYVMTMEIWAQLTTKIQNTKKRKPNR